MKRERFERVSEFSHPRDWVEPAHPAIIRLYDELLSLYRIMQEKFQQQVDQAFDRASRQIGFVVTSTLPIVMSYKEGKLEDVRMGAEHLEGTIFAEAILPVAKQWGEAATELKLQGSYKLYMLWHEALALKLRTDWIEPAHYVSQIPSWMRGRIRPEVMEPAHWRGIDWEKAVRPEVMEPAHWFNPRFDIAVEDKVLISVIDQIYADLHLVDRIGGIRERIRDLQVAVPPEVMEPAHFRPELRQELQTMMGRIQEILKDLR
jgi:hypothetical protein